MTPQKTIKWSLFPEWLQAQPAERVFNYGACTDCVVASFLKETGQMERPNCSPWDFNDLSDAVVTFGIPKPITKLVDKVRMEFHLLFIRAGNLQAAVTPDWSPIDLSDNEPIIPAPEPSITQSTQRLVEERGAR